MELTEEQKALIQELARTIPNIAETLNQNLEVLKEYSPNYEKDKSSLNLGPLHEQITALNLIYGEVRLIESYLARLMPDYKSHLSPAMKEDNPRRNKPGGYPTE